MDIIDIPISLGISILGVVMGAWVAKKMLFSRENIMETIDSALDYVLNTVEGQSKVKAVMEKLAEGLMKGTGLTSKAGKKLSLQDIILQLGVSYAQSRGWLGTSLNQAQNQQEQSKNPLDR